MSWTAQELVIKAYRSGSKCLVSHYNGVDTDHFEFTLAQMQTISLLAQVRPEARIYSGREGYEYYHKRKGLLILDKAGDFTKTRVITKVRRYELEDVLK